MRDEDFASYSNDCQTTKERKKGKPKKLRQRSRSAKARSQSHKPPNNFKREPSPCKVTMQYHGKGINIPFDKHVFDSKDQIIVSQQHCGGENLVVFKRRLDQDGKSF